MTAKMLLEQYMAERHALGFVSKTDEGCIRRFLRDYKEPEDGKIVFSKEYVLEHIGTGLNQKANTVLRDVSAINGFLNFVIRKGFTAYKIPPKSMPKEVRNFRAYIFTDTEIEKMLDSADHFPVCMQNPVKKYQIPVMFRMLFNCGLRTSELLNLRVCDVDFTEKVLAIRDTKFHKSRLVPFTDAVAILVTTSLDHDLVRKANMIPASSPDEALQKAYDLVGKDASVVVIPDGVAVLAVKENGMEPLGYTHNSGHF